MSKGLPLVVSESIGIPELITERILGFVIKKDKRMGSKYDASVLKSFVSGRQIIQEMSDASMKTSKSLIWGSNSPKFFTLITMVVEN